MKLCIQHLAFSYKKQTVLKDVDFCLESGSYVFVLGRNGAGKSTLFKCILGILKGYKGKILLDGNNIRTLPGRELASLIAYIPQQHAEAFPFSVLDMVLMGTTAAFSPLSIPGKQQKETAQKAMKLVGIENLATHSYAHLSGGEQQLVLIARAIAQNARILIMDEPCANLDYGNQIHIMEELKQLSREGYLIIQSTHNPEHAFLFADQVLVLENGQTDSFGPPDQVLTSRLLESIYEIPVSLHLIPGTDLQVCAPDISKSAPSRRKNSDKNW